MLRPPERRRMPKLVLGCARAKDLMAIVKKARHGIVGTWRVFVRMEEFPQAKRFSLVVVAI